MNSMNRVLLLGHLTANPRVRTTSSGKTVCDFGLALNRRWLDLNGDRQQETTFVDVTAWNQQAEVIGAYCQKGRPIAVEGRLEQEALGDPGGREALAAQGGRPARHVPARPRRDRPGGRAAARLGGGGTER